jgi:hypothetical protein
LGLGYWDVIALDDEFEQERGSKRTGMVSVKIMQKLYGKSVSIEEKKLIKLRHRLFLVENTKHNVPYMLKKKILFI